MYIREKFIFYNIFAACIVFKGKIVFAGGVNQWRSAEFTHFKIIP